MAPARRVLIDDEDTAEEMKYGSFQLLKESDHHMATIHTPRELDLSAKAIRSLAVSRGDVSGAIGFAEGQWPHAVASQIEDYHRRSV